MYINQININKEYILSFRKHKKNVYSVSLYDTILKKKIFYYCDKNFNNGTDEAFKFFCTYCLFNYNDNVELEKFKDYINNLTLSTGITDLDLLDKFLNIYKMKIYFNEIKVKSYKFIILPFIV